VVHSLPPIADAAHAAGLQPLGGTSQVLDYKAGQLQVIHPPSEVCLRNVSR
jgi:hypothetical protein